MIVVDSSVWIARLRGQHTAATGKLEAAAAREPLLIGDLILLEVLQRKDRLDLAHCGDTFDQKPTRLGSIPIPIGMLARRDHNIELRRPCVVDINNLSMSDAKFARQEVTKNPTHRVLDVRTLIAGVLKQRTRSRQACRELITDTREFLLKPGKCRRIASH